MIEYPKQIFCVWSTNMSFDGVFQLMPAQEETSTVPPLEMHEKNLSRYDLTILDRTGGKKAIPAKFSLPAKDVLPLYEKVRIALLRKEMFTPTEASETGALARNTIINIGRFKGKTPAELLIADANNKAELLKTREFMVPNATKYPANKKVIAAIDEAIELFEIGELKSGDSSAKMMLYERQMKLNPKEDAKGYHTVTGILMYCDFSRRYPWYVEITNSKAKTKLDAGGNAVVDGSTITQTVRNGIYLGDDDFLFAFTQMKELLLMFQSKHFNGMLARAEKLDRINRENYRKSKEAAESSDKEPA